MIRIESKLSIKPTWLNKMNGGIQRGCDNTANLGDSAG